ncbi:MAG TPA: response regulator [Gemmatimonadaceae bacterium]|nr:response regulator [Gemmatimonadaceae bacterium]
MASALTTIAVIDDDEGVRAAMSQLLRAASYAAVAYASAEDFLRSPEAASVDCLIVDVNLPGMSGAALLQTLAARGSRIPAILISARDDLTTRELVRVSGAVPFLRKPFGSGELFAAITGVLRS